MRKRTWWATVGWRAGDMFFGVQAWTRRGAIKEARRRASVLKPRADLLFVSISR